MEKSSKKSISEIVETARDYAAKLEELIESVQRAEMQIRSSAGATLAEIDSAFDQLARTLSCELERRRERLRREALDMQDESLGPLEACRELIAGKLATTRGYIAQGRHLLDGTAGHDEALAFADQASQLGSLPAVPNLEEVPELSFQCAVAGVARELAREVRAIGAVSRMGPVQLTDLSAKPGALLVHWEEVDYERAVDVHSFRLQLAYGDVRGQEQLEACNYHDVYEGPERQFLVRDLQPDTPYTFRVCCRAEGSAGWSAWSLPRVAATAQPPFRWDDSNTNYVVTNEGKIASKVSAEQSLLLSSAAQFGPCHSIEFTVLECGVGCSDEGLGLVDELTEKDTLVQPGCFFINTKGSVFVDGVEKTTRLPALQKGSKVCFTCEHIRAGRMRVNVDSGDKAVTYDWDVHSLGQKLYFALCFGQAGWKVLVE
ncbi:cytokine receptor-like factor 3 [Bacillus rossius redtenbacheri]|uniref:cytokine receptor-like factor 3 n=1 Tax=Bacillus rossius redtenbacheri TaxID=93214 RepID=UPI002FDD1711